MAPAQPDAELACPPSSARDQVSGCDGFIGTHTMAEVGRAQPTIFLARFLRDRDLQREINEGLNVVESWNRANAVIFLGKGGDIATNRRDEQELSCCA
jgi:TnpA family transposase